MTSEKSAQFIQTIKRVRLDVWKAGVQINLHAFDRKAADPLSFATKNQRFRDRNWNDKPTIRRPNPVAMAQKSLGVLFCARSTSPEMNLMRTKTHHADTHHQKPWKFFRFLYCGSERQR